MKALASAHISAKNDSLKIFTDASKLDDNRMAAAFYVPKNVSASRQELVTHIPSTTLNYLQ